MGWREVTDLIEAHGLCDCHSESGWMDGWMLRVVVVTSFDIFEYLQILRQHSSLPPLSPSRPIEFDRWTDQQVPFLFLSLPLEYSIRVKCSQIELHWSGAPRLVNSYSSARTHARQ